MARRRPVRPPRSGGAPGRIGIWQDAVAWSGLFCATLIAYAPALEGGLVWDDTSHVTAPGFESLHGLWRIWFELGATQQYYPLLHSAFWLEHRIWGDAVLGYHLANVVLHAISAYLVVRIVRRLSLPGAWIAGLIFALHPVCVEAVAWISEQKSTLSGVYYLGAALTYLNFDRTRRKRSYLLALGLFLLALLTKTVTATLPAALLVVLWWMRGRLGWRRDVVPLLPWFGLAVPAGLLTTWVERVFVGAHGSAFTLTPLQRLLLAGRVPWFYAAKALWPADLMFSYPRWKIDPSEWWQYLFPAGLVAVTIALGLLARRSRGPLSGFLIFVGTLFPVLGFLSVYPFRFSYVADHFQYLAILGIIVPAASWLAGFTQRILPGKAGAIAFAALLLTTLGSLTWRQSGLYRDYETLFRSALAGNPDGYLLHANLGSLLIAMPGRLPDAIAEFQAALRADPSFPEVHYDLGLAYSQMPGRLPDAIAEYQEALRIDPNYAAAHNNLGSALTHIPGRLPDAIAEFQAALKADPSFPDVHFNLGLAYSQMPGRKAEATAEYRAALRVNPNSVVAHYNLGNIFVDMPGRAPDAIAEYQAALRINPNIADVHYNLAYALAQAPGRQSDAIAECRETLRISPDYELARRLMDSLLAIRDGRGR